MLVRKDGGVYAFKDELVRHMRRAGRVVDGVYRVIV